MPSHVWAALLASISCAAISGCGTALPSMDYRFAGDQEFGQFVKAISSHVRCEMRQAVVSEYSPYDPARSKLRKWGAKIALTLTAFDKSQLSPGVSLTNVAQTFATGLGADLQADATREMTMTYFIPFESLFREQRDMGSREVSTRCEQHVDQPVAGNLGIRTTLRAALETWDGFYPLSNDLLSGDPFDTITHHVTFQVEATGDVSPTWKFVNVSVNSSGKLFSATRRQTDELLITMGPTVLGDRKVTPGPSQTLLDSFFAERLRSSIRPQ